MNSYHKLLWTIMPALICLSLGCNAFLPRRQTPPEGQIPQAYAMSDTETTTEHPNEWWESFNSEELNELVREALQQNLTLHQAWARLDQTRSTATQAAAGLYPEISLEGNANYTRTVKTVEGVDSPSWQSQLKDAAISGVTKGIGNALGGTTGSTGTTGQNTSALSGLSNALTSENETSPQRVTTEIKQFGLSLAVSYEVDLWRRVYAQAQAADFDVQATRNDLEAAAMTLTAEIVTRWLTILEQQALKDLLQQQLETNETYLELVELRFRKSLVSALDVYQQRQAVSEVRKLIPQIEAQEQTVRHGLAVLLGKPPSTDFNTGNYDLAAIPPLPSPGLPADLLINRPDIRAALAQLQAADYRVAVAKADRLPAVRLTGGVGYEADDIANIFDDWFLNLGSNLTAPLFDGFRREAEVERTLAVVRERLAAYRLTVLTAINEVEDALVQERKQHEFIKALTQQLQDARNALKEAGQRYRKGLNDYLPVLTALERTQLLTRNLVTARRELLTFRVNLYRSLGGSWTTELQAPIPLDEQEELAKAEKSS